MRSFNFLHPLVRWINLLPIWRRGRVNVWEVSLRAPTFDRWLCLILHRFGLMGRTDRAFLLTHVQPGMTVVDIGANQGLYTLLFSRRVGASGRVFAFEPDDMLHAFLKENISHNEGNNVRTYHCALGSTGETMTLYRSLMNSGDNRLASNSREAGPREPVQVRVEPLDALLTNHQIDLIKMDVQGWEMEALRGMEGILDHPQNERLAIYFEYWPQGLRDANSSSMEPLIFLSGKRFRLFQVGDAQMIPIVDAEEFAHSIKGNTYVNLYAARGLVVDQAV